MPPNLTDAEKKSRPARDRFAAGGLEKALKGKPAAFFVDAKRALFEKLESVVPAGCIVASNTSGPLPEAARAGGGPGHRPSDARPGAALRRRRARQGHRHWPGHAQLRR